MVTTITKFSIKQAVLNLQLINTEPLDSTTSLTEMVLGPCLVIMDTSHPTGNLILHLAEDITTPELAIGNLSTGGVVTGQSTGLDSMVIEQSLARGMLKIGV